MKKVFFFTFIFLFLSLSTFAQEQPNLKVMRDMGKAGKATIDTNSIKQKEYMVYFDVYYINRPEKDISYILHGYEMNCTNGDWRIVKMFHMMKNNKKVYPCFARKEPFPQDSTSTVYQKFVCKGKYSALIKKS